MELAKYEGDVYFGTFNPTTGAFSGYTGPYECEAFEPSREAGESIEMKSKRRDMYGQTIYSEQQPGTTKLSIGFREQPAAVLELMYGANVSLISVVAGAVTDEEIPAASVGKSYMLSKRNLKASPAPVVKSQGGSPVTYVAGTDYSIDLRSGRITFPAGSDIVEGDPLDASFSYDALQAEGYNGETVPQRHLRVYFDGKNRVSQKDFQIEYFDVLVNAPEDIMDLLSSELITATIEGTVLTPTGQTSPYRIIKEI